MFFFFNGEPVSECSYFALIRNLRSLLCLPLMPYLEWISILSFIHLLQTDFQISRSRRSQKFFKIDISKNFAIFIGKRLCWSLFLIKFHAFRPSALLTRDSNTCVFLWILRNYQEHLFYRTLPGDRFCD